MIELIEALGYVHMDGELFAFVGNYFVVLNHGASQIDDEVMQLRM